MTATASPVGNLILDRLSGDELVPLLSAGQTISLPLSHELFREGGPVKHVYFPTKGVYGLVILGQGGERVEAATIGNEGLLGLSVFLGIDFTPYTVITQVPGDALRVPAATFLQAARAGTSLDRLLRRYAVYRMRAASQTVACNTLHCVEERMCRWLLTAHDRAAQDELPITQEFLSELLGVRRQTVALVAGTLQRAGLLTYRRGILRVLDREAMENSSCECYEATKALYERIMA
jgi:CRP-like cAMP-binding protein